ncbi:MAG: ATP synthase F1 subunit gamma [Spirochaetaceae bacterium]|jgi:F-type H+-transporting ATPase subunit gamma|nr:ATP synthase F1 subunit gamma [Spirochaetaceae bacterium]
MPNLRDVRLRMRAVEQTLKVTRAMDLISTAKLRKGRRTLEDVEPYFTRIQKSVYDILNNVWKKTGAAALPDGENPLESKFFGRKNSKAPSRRAVVVVTSDKGLAGGYNANMFRAVSELAREIQNPILILIGNIGYRYFVNSPFLILENFSFQSKLPEVDDAKEIADYLIAQYSWGMFDEVFIVYTHMYSSVKLEPAVRHILPLSPDRMREELAHFEYEERADLQFEYLPSVEAVFAALVPLYIKGIIYGCLVEAYASEQSARMAAMSEASQSAEEMLESLRIRYNRERQAGITQEMTEIVSGSAALQS